jgi:hypothetical protein
MRLLWTITILAALVGYLIGLDLESRYSTWQVDKNLNLYLAPPPVAEKHDRGV